MAVFQIRQEMKIRFSDKTLEYRISLNKACLEKTPALKLRPAKIVSLLNRLGREGKLWGYWIESQGFIQKKYGRYFHDVIQTQPAGVKKMDTKYIRQWDIKQGIGSTDDRLQHLRGHNLPRRAPRTCCCRWLRPIKWKIQTLKKTIENNEHFLVRETYPSACFSISLSRILLIDSSTLFVHEWVWNLAVV